MRRHPFYLRATLGCLLLVAGCGGGLQEILRDLDGDDAEPRPRSALRETSPQASTPEPLAAPTADKPPAPPPPPPDPVPERLGTPASSAAKKPTWSVGRGGYAPQPTDSQALFNASSGPLRGEQVGLACKLGITTTNHGDFDGMADLSVAVSITQGKEVTKLYAYGGEDTTEMWFTVPLVTLEKGAKMSVLSVDRDLVFDDGIESIRATFTGSYPLTAKGRISALECRPLGREVVEKHLESSRIGADKYLREMEAVHPDLLEPYLGVGMGGDGGAMSTERAIENMAGLVGWDDPRVVRRAERLVAQRKRITDELGAAVEAMRKKLPSPAEGPTPVADGALSAHVTSYLCGREAEKKYRRGITSYKPKDPFDQKPCVFAMDLVNRTGAPFEVSAFHDEIGPLGKLQLISSTGARFSVELLGELRDGKLRPVGVEVRPFVPAGATVSILARVEGKGELAAFAPPLLLRGMHKKRRTGTPREWTSVAGGALSLRATDLTCNDKGCVLRAALRSSGSGRVEINSFFKRIEKPRLGLRLLDPAAITPPKKDKHGYAPHLEDSIKGPYFEPFAIVERGVQRPLDADVAIGPGHTVELAFAMQGDRLPGGMDLDKLALDTWFDEVPSFLRIEPAAAPGP